MSPRLKFCVFCLVGLAAACGGDGDISSPNVPPTAAFSSACADLACSFSDSSSDADGRIAAYRWSFGDGSPDESTRDAQHTYAVSGTYLVTLSVADDRGATDSVAGAAHPVTRPNALPVASFGSSCVDLTCTFSDASTDADGQVTAYTWDFGDGAAGVITKDAVHTYATGNTYAVKLTVTDNEGATGDLAQSVLVQAPANVPPTADFASSCVGLACSFTGLGSDGDGTVVGFHWHFGDGAIATTQNATHAYASAGTYAVDLTVTDDGGATGHRSRQVTVTGPQVGEPTAGFAGSCVIVGSFGRIVFIDCTFTDQSTAAAGATLTAWAWDFGNGRTSTEQNPPVRHYTMSWFPGLRVAARLTVTDNHGLTNSVSRSIPVRRAQ